MMMSCYCFPFMVCLVKESPKQDRRRAKHNMKLDERREWKSLRFVVRFVFTMSTAPIISIPRGKVIFH